MTKLNFHRPIELTKEAKDCWGNQSVAVFNADGNRVVWIGDHVFPIDNAGKALAEVTYPNFGSCDVGDQLIQNVVEKPVKKEVPNLFIFVKSANTNHEWRVWSAAPLPQSKIAEMVKNIKIKHNYNEVKVVKVA